MNEKTRVTTRVKRITQSIPITNTKISYDKWQPWTNLSKSVSYDKITKGVGKGEYKLAAEFGTKPLGQNVSYDLQTENGEKFEVKELDSQESFRLGVKVSSEYTRLISNVIRIFENVSKLKDVKSFPEIEECIQKIEDESRTPLIHGLRKNEVSQTNLKKANEIIELLKIITVFEDKKNIKLYSSYDGNEYKYNIIDAYGKLSYEQISIDEKYGKIGGNDIYIKAQISNAIKDDMEIFKDKTLIELLNEVVRNVFDDISLVVVDEKKGYKIVKNKQNIICNRITSGNPRCKVL
jgi:hypothetical protein